MNYTVHTAHTAYTFTIFSLLLWFFMPFCRVQFLYCLKTMQLHDFSEFELRKKDNASSSRSSKPTKIDEEKMHHREMYPSKKKWLCYIAFHRRKINLCNLHLRSEIEEKMHGNRMHFVRPLRGGTEQSHGSKRESKIIYWCKSRVKAYNDNYQKWNKAKYNNAKKWNIWKIKSNSRRY